MTLLPLSTSTPDITTSALAFHLSPVALHRPSATSAALRHLSGKPLILVLSVYNSLVGRSSTIISRALNQSMNFLGPKHGSFFCCKFHGVGGTSVCCLMVGDGGLRKRLVVAGLREDEVEGEGGSGGGEKKKRVVNSITP
ncbi:hypothetical protein LR48_Vigan04g186900 [Vigna angularis]|uniref:Uncharacterized protein n=1 Tax=Phaseolus angularis TaxID=3914 RepID=A0A0L9UG32_PHAAN|nr:hypothetical protein LR48_Vigan04g186900 [Vigna angularis]